MPETIPEPHEPKTDSFQPTSASRSWLERVANRVRKILPVKPNPSEWFSINEARVAEILERVRSELPTTEAVLIGKPQSGKSSIVRGLTGVAKFGQRSFLKEN